MRERLNHWLTLVQRGDVLPSYRVFLGLMQDVPNRRHVLAHLAFAGLIDVQDRMWHNRSYTTGHKGYRARATIELGEAIGWDLAHHVLYAGVPDMAVGPRWYSGYELGCNVIQNQLDGRDQELLAQTTPLTAAEEAMLIDVITRQREFSVVDALVALLRAGRNPRRILDAIQVAAAQVILETGEPNNYSMAQHGYEYCNTVGWFYDTFEHPHRLKLLFLAALFINRGSEHQANTPGNGRRTIAPPLGSDAWSAHQILEKLECALLANRTEESVDLTAAYLKGGYDRAPLVQTLATGAAIMGNDPHNQELGLCTLEDYLKTQAHDRDRLLAGERSAHGRTPEVRRSAGGVSALRRRDGCGRALARGYFDFGCCCLISAILAIAVAGEAIAVARQLPFELLDLVPALRLVQRVPMEDLALGHSRLVDLARLGDRGFLLIGQRALLDPGLAILLARDAPWPARTRSWVLRKASS